MSFMTTFSPLSDEVAADYSPASVYDGRRVPASIWVRLLKQGERVGANLNLSIEDARVLGEALTQIVLLHDAAERLAAAKAVDADSYGEPDRITHERSACLYPDGCTGCVPCTADGFPVIDGPASPDVQAVA